MTQEQEREKLVAEWCELVGQSVQVEQIENKREDRRGHRQKSGEAEASRQLGLSRPDVHRARKVANLSESAQEKARLGRTWWDGEKFVRALTSDATNRNTLYASFCPHHFDDKKRNCFSCKNL
jgi:hypothetical protein